MDRPETELLRRPEARVETVEDLVAKILRGEVRIPRFQRGLRWKAQNVLELFDSIYRGFPIGSLLLRQGYAPGAEFEIGPLRIFGESTTHALWVVDGQQRLTALAAALGRSEMPEKPEDYYVVYFDAENQAFRAPPKQDSVPTTWVPVNRLLDAAQLSEWIHTWSHRDAFRKTLFDAGRRIREYPLPEYVIHSDDEEVLRSIFHRTNTTGVRLTWDEVHDALYGHRGTEPSTVAELATRLEAMGMGRPGEEELLPCLVAFKGLDVTRALGEHLRADPRVLDGVVKDALPVLEDVFGFLRVRAEIPHLRLLPYVTPVIVLTRFFAVHRDPSERTRSLLVRWIWRSFLGGSYDDRVLKRRGVDSISQDEEASVQALLKLVSSVPAIFEIAEQFDARSANSRLVLLALASLGPRALDNNGPIDIASTIRSRERGNEVFRPIFPPRGNMTRSPANRLVLPGRGSAAGEFRAFIAKYGTDHITLRSHAIDRDIAAAIDARDVERALRLRNQLIVGAVATLGEKLGEWGRSDRPSIDYLLRAQA